MNVSEFIQRSDLFAVHSCNRGAEQLAREINIWGEIRYYESLRKNLLASDVGGGL